MQEFKINQLNLDFKLRSQKNSKNIQNLHYITQELASTGQQAISLQVSAIKAWSLLFTLLTPEYVHAVAPELVFPLLLNSSLSFGV